VLVVAAGAQLVLPAPEGIGREVDGELDDIRQRVLRGEFQAARAFLTRLRERSWDTLSPRQRWRVCTMQADMDVREDRREEAARQLIEAREHQPDEEVALTNEVFAHELLGDRARARALAQQARVRFPNSGVIYSACVRTAQDDDEFERLLRELPAQLAKHTKVWAEAAVRAEGLDSTSMAEDAERRATVYAGEDPRTWFGLGSILLRTEALKIDPEEAPQQTRPDVVRLAEADSCFTKAADLARSSDASFAANALVRRAATRDFSGRLQEAQADIDEAFKLAPSDPSVRVAHARLLADRGNKDASIRALREALAQVPAHETRFLLGMALCDRNLDGDRIEGAHLLRECAMENGEHSGTALLFGVEAFISVILFDDAAGMLDAVPRADEALVATMRARVALERKQEEDAQAHTTRAIGLVGSSTARDTLRKLGKVLASLKRFRDSVEIWRRVAVLAGPVTDDIRWLVETAVQCGQDAVVLRLGKDARDRGEFDPHLIEMELRLLGRYDPNEAAEILLGALARKPEDKHARLNLALLALRLPRTNLGTPTLEELPDVRDARVEEGAAVVQVLVETGRRKEARTYAYDLLRRHFDSVVAHRAFWYATLLREGADDEGSVDREIATAGNAVCYIERGTTQEKWAVLEDSTVEVNDVPEEVRRGSSLASAFEGKRVGDTVVLAEGPAQDRTARIAAVISKHAYRVRDVMNNWELRFPEHKEVWMVNVGGADGQLDVTPFIRLAEKTQARTKEAEELYRTRPLGIWLFGRALGQDEIHAAIHLASADGQTFRCCVGTEAEDREAAAAFDAATEVVIDPTAVATVLLLGQIAVLEALEKQVVISHGTFGALQALHRDAKSRERAFATFGAGPTGQPAFTMAPEEQKKSAVEAAARLLDLASTRWRIVGSRQLADLEPGLRELLFKGFGEAALQSACIGAPVSRVLWTDDAAVAAMAKEQFGTRRIWTQSLLRRLVASRSIDDEACIKASAGLVALRYHFTSVTPEILRRAAQWADWLPDRLPMPQVLDYLTSPNTRTEDAAGLAASVVAFAYRDIVLPEKRGKTLIAVAEAVGHRHDASRAVVLMQLFLARTFGLDLIGQVDAARTFAAWKVTFDRRVRAP
jgi:tetratricopeptide (TPR) repeat protein